MKRHFCLLFFCLLCFALLIQIVFAYYFCRILNGTRGIEILHETCIKVIDWLLDQIQTNLKQENDREKRSQSCPNAKWRLSHKNFVK